MNFQINVALGILDFNIKCLNTNAQVYKVYVYTSTNCIPFIFKELLKFMVISNENKMNCSNIM